jgi:hypothetical protein
VRFSLVSARVIRTECQSAFSDEFRISGRKTDAVQKIERALGVGWFAARDGIVIGLAPISFSPARMKAFSELSDFREFCTRIMLMREKRSWRVC